MGEVEELFKRCIIPCLVLPEAFVDAPTVSGVVGCRGVGVGALKVGAVALSSVWFAAVPWAKAYKAEVH